MFRQVTFRRSCQLFNVSSSALSKLAPPNLNVCTYSPDVVTMTSGATCAA